MHGVDDDVEFERMVELIDIHVDDEGKREVGSDSFQVGGVWDLIGKGGVVERSADDGIDDGLWF